MPHEPHTTSSSERISRLAQALVQTGLRSQSALDGVHLCDVASLSARGAGSAVSILILCGGHQRANLGEQMHPVRHHYLVQTAQGLSESLIDETTHGAVACLSVQIDLQLAAELALALDDVRHVPAATHWMGGSLPLDEAMSGTVLRLLQVLPCPVNGSILGPGIVRELLYRVLTGPQGAAVNAALTHQGSMKRIAKALRRMREAYAGAVDVAGLANEAGMSIAAFHAHFKAVTQTTPIQFLKTTRLQRARLLMLHEGVSAARASRLVGYESNSQFGREFKRLFGSTPTKEAARMKAALSVDRMAQAHQLIDPSR